MPKNNRFPQIRKVFTTLGIRSLSLGLLDVKSGGGRGSKGKQTYHYCAKLVPNLFQTRSKQHLQHSKFWHACELISDPGPTSLPHLLISLPPHLLASRAQVDLDEQELSFTQRACRSCKYTACFVVLLLAIILVGCSDGAVMAR